MYSVAILAGNSKKMIVDTVRRNEEETNLHSSNRMKERKINSVNAAMKGATSLTIQEIHVQRQKRRQHVTTIPKVYKKKNVYSKLKVSDIIIFLYTLISQKQFHFVYMYIRECFIPLHIFVNIVCTAVQILLICLAYSLIALLEYPFLCME